MFRLFTRIGKDSKLLFLTFIFLLLLQLSKPTPSTIENAIETKRYKSNIIITHTRYCTNRETIRQGSFVQNNLTTIIKKNGGCHSDYLQTIQQYLPTKQLTVIDIGMNKGYVSANLLNLFAPELKINSSFLYRTLQKQYPASCGICNECIDDTIKIFMNNVFLPTIRLFSYDGFSYYVEKVKKAREDMIQELHSNNENMRQYITRNWKIETFAFTDKYEENQKITFQGFGEFGGIRPIGTKHTTLVPVMTIDQIIKRENLTKIDFIKIDTEGHDPSVLRGARNALNSHLITVIVFEYNHIWEKQDLLEDVMKQNFLNKNYACYLQIFPQIMIKLTHSCWSSQLEIRTWSNVICVSLQSQSGQNIASKFDSVTAAFIL